MALILSVHQLTKSFAGKQLFQNISFGIEEGERVALLGPNGVGKSTLMKILMQQLGSDSGSVVARRGLKIAYLPQSPIFHKQDTLLSLLLKDYTLEPDQLAKAYEWMAKLELSSFAEDTKILELSGGWQKRVALAEQLIHDPDLLLLDEPTNHLDVAGIKWLEEFLSSSRFASLVITHDRLFLQRVSQKILDLDPRFPGHMLSVQGGYEKYLETKSSMAADQLSREQKMANTLRREKEWLHRGAQARQTKQRARMESADRLADEVRRLKFLNQKNALDLSFEANEKGPQKLIVAEGLGKKSYNHAGHEPPSDQPPGPWLFRQLHMILTPKTRLALLGHNGSGKSTLIRTLLGLVKQDEGRVRLAEDLKFAYFEQNRETLDAKKSVLHNICPEGDYVNFRGQHVHVRSYLERFRFFKDKLNLPLAQLSGGEQARLRLAQMMLHECQVLILDEPTNDLDIETLNVLEDALRDFEGAVILVTHDRYFMDQVCSQILSFNPFPESPENNSGEVLFFADYAQWEAWYEATEVLNKTKKVDVVFANGNNTENMEQSTGNKKLSYKERLEFEQMESKILSLESKLKILQTELALPQVGADVLRVQELYQEIHLAQSHLDTLYKRWTELEARALP